jgi:uncharacterized membrane protein HdeD (DUF308 family)
MLAILGRNWWAFVLRGVLAILFGLAAWFFTGATLVTLIYLFGAYALVDGIFALVAIFVGGGSEGRWIPLLIEGVAGIIIGIVTLLNPGATGVVLLYFIATWALVTGAFEILAAVRLRKEIEDEWWLGLSGLASLVFGAVLLILSLGNPLAGALAVVWIIGLYAIIFGAFLIGLGLRLRSLQDTLRPTSASMP